MLHSEGRVGCPCLPDANKLVALHCDIGERDVLGLNPDAGELHGRGAAAMKAVAKAAWECSCEACPKPL